MLPRLFSHGKRSTMIGMLIGSMGCTTASKPWTYSTVRIEHFSLSLKNFQGLAALSGARFSSNIIFKFFLSEPKLETSNLSAVITQLSACETYTFTVGVVGPLGYGPLSRNWIELTTSPDPKAPPKRLTVTKDNENPLRMKLQWAPPCEISESTGYVVSTFQYFILFGSGFL